MRILALVGAPPEVENLVAGLLGCLRARGLSASLIFLDRDDRDYDQPGKDSFRHRAAGAVETALVGENVYAISAARPARLNDLIARLLPVDVVLVVADAVPDKVPWIGIGMPPADEKALAWVTPAAPTDRSDGLFAITETDRLCTFILDATQEDKTVRE